DKIIDPQGPVAMCPECGHRHPFLQLPLLLVSGASGAGKSTICHALLGALPEVVLLDSDILCKPRQRLLYVYALLSRLDFQGFFENAIIVFLGITAFSPSKKPTSLMM